ncbi:MAG: UDP-glucose 4-epimerase [Chlamydiae bacterium]|nr:UDP-glucose 4-epimerase [Chlamydiota bacterium]
MTGYSQPIRTNWITTGMRIFVAGATGAIGRPLVSRLVSEGHEVFGMTRSKEGSLHMINIGAKPIIADALDAASLSEAVRRCQPEVVIEMLTSLPKEYTPQSMRDAAPQNQKLRVVGGANLQNAAESAGVRRYILQSSAFWYLPGSGLATEVTPFALDPSLPIAESAKVYADQEKRVLEKKNIEGVALRFGFFYGPGTWYDKGGSMARQVKSTSYPLVGAGEGVWNFVHIEDAALAISLALNCPMGAYNITNDTPLKQAEWLPAYAQWLGAPAPPTRTVEKELQINGPVSVYYATRLRGASNEKAKNELGFQPRPLEWITTTKKRA